MCPETLFQFFGHLQYTNDESTTGTTRECTSHRIPLAVVGHSVCGRFAEIRFSASTAEDFSERWGSSLPCNPVAAGREKRKAVSENAQISRSAHACLLSQARQQGCSQSLASVQLGTFHWAHLLNESLNPADGRTGFQVELPHRGTSARTLSLGWIRPEVHKTET